jgi:hypothetical protein
MAIGPATPTTRPDAAPRPEPERLAERRQCPMGAAGCTAGRAPDLGPKRARPRSAHRARSMVDIAKPLSLDGERPEISSAPCAKSLGTPNHLAYRHGNVDCNPRRRTYGAGACRNFGLVRTYSSMMAMYCSGVMANFSGGQYQRGLLALSNDTLAQEIPCPIPLT